MSTLPKNTAPRLQDLATELIDKVAAELDDATLLALISTSRSLRSKAYYVFGDRFFKTLKFFLHPISLQALADISNIRALASHVQTVAFGTEIVGIFDPLHDEDIKLGTLVHSLSSTSAIPIQQIKIARSRVDAHVISQAFKKLPKLQLIMVGKDLSLQGRPIRRSWGTSKISSFRCPSKHCLDTENMEAIYVVFQTVVSAVEQTRLRQEVKFCIGLGLEDQLYVERYMLQLRMQKAALGLMGRLKHLQLNLNRMDRPIMGDFVPQLFRPYIETLDVIYSPHMKAISLCLDYLPLGGLQRLTLKKLWTNPTTLAIFLSNHKDRLVHVSLIDCSVVNSLYNTENTWLCVIKGLQQMPQLTSLCLDYLQSALVRSSSSPLLMIQRDESLDEGKTLSATWQGKDEIANGLRYLIATHRTFTVPQPELQTHVSPLLQQLHYLNLRYANFKAASCYAWTVEEAKSINKIRDSRSHYLHSGQTPDIVDDRDEFPVPYYYVDGKLPTGHVVLPAVLWGRWRTVWVSNAPKVWKFGSW
ncbi:uncharacterized protein K460DRAFT_294413 [Cucurbitaria berberidis CBS 394.84]|uniref:Uncharacterized protein n=1 Tax=Cucurbitaria berberidis CBS 394.84 TaxID=1168544 RepID=A0A9P4G8U6_9PLEO|nr:uncharacterized protein K460DRAFT_294413 [Cucurbitaria berberidis CBS 394.84]KAF1841243.1 hypothetical protein K460DRAFT_294413 [Cucurbitaria berberidis CBS 394.84]